MNPITFLSRALGGRRSFRWLAAFALGACVMVPGVPVLAEDSEVDAVPLQGRWGIDPDDQAEQVLFTIDARGRSWQMNWTSSGVPLARIEGLGAYPGPREARQVQFRVRRDAGTFVCQGVLENGHGAGLFSLELSPAFASELVRRGIGRPTQDQQARLAYSDASLELLDELKKQGYPTPQIDLFTKMARHGVRLSYLRGMAEAGYRFGTLPELIKARDHGVDPNFVEEMRKAGYRDLPFEDLLRARDHGVNARYLSGMAGVGFKGAPLQDLVRARDHGVDADFVREVRGRHSESLTLEEIIRIRDRGRADRD